MKAKPIKLFFRLVLRFDLATALFRSFELTAVKEILSRYPAHQCILDIGCAEGIIGKEVFKKNQAIGLDYDAQFLSQAKRRNWYRLLVNGDASRMPFREDFFLFVFSNSVLEHIQPIDKVLAETQRILQRNGLFLFTVPNHKFGTHLFFYRLFKIAGLKNLTVRYAQERNRRLSHFHTYAHEQWNALLQTHGFRIIEIKDYIPGLILSAWDLIAAIQFVLNGIFGFLFKIPVFNLLAMLISFCLKIIGGIFVLPLFIFSIQQKDCCATLFIAKKEG